MTITTHLIEHPNPVTTTEQITQLQQTYPGLRHDLALTEILEPETKQKWKAAEHQTVIQALTLRTPRLVIVNSTETLDTDRLLTTLENTAPTSHVWFITKTLNTLKPTFLGRMNHTWTGPDHETSAEQLNQHLANLQNNPDGLADTASIQAAAIKALYDGEINTTQTQTILKITEQYNQRKDAHVPTTQATRALTAELETVLTVSQKPQPLPNLQ